MLRPCAILRRNSDGRLDKYDRQSDRTLPTGNRTIVSLPYDTNRLVEIVGSLYL